MKVPREQNTNGQPSATSGGGASDEASVTHPRVVLAPITDRDLHDVARFLGVNFPPDTPAAEWAEAWRSTVNLPGSDAPNHGYLLRSGREVVGAYPAIYSTREVGGRLEHFCNLASWYTLPRYRPHSIKMMLALLAQPGWHVTDLAPIEVVQRLNLRLGFRYLDTTAALVPNHPWASFHRAQVHADPAVIESKLTGEVRGFYLDHARCRWARHLVLVAGDRSCYLQWRMEWHKHVPLASVRYASDPELLRRHLRLVGSFLLLHHGAVGTTVEHRVAGGPVALSLRMPHPKARMFRSDYLRPEDIDYLYSEISSAP